ncbi:MAG: uroporphyrinogen-III synthase [Phaeodactylibacter sp.]|nr:uroporphyrinogen-III synthase [Phaeodactylibacter sp.]
MQPTVFISRELKKDSPFRLRLEAIGAEVRGQSLIEFTPVDFGTAPPCDWVFFYSKKAVRFFFEGLDGAAPDTLKWAALGRGTAAALSARGITPDFIGTGEPEGVAAAFAEEAASRRVLFPQARHSRQSIQQLLEGKIQAASLVVYDNRPLESFNIPFCQVLTFTSPLNAEAYFGKYALQEGQAVVAIGSTTAAALHRLGVKEVAVADAPSEEGLAAAVAALLNGG